MAGATALIHLEKAVKIYRMGEVEVRALDGVDLDVPEGDFVAVMHARGHARLPLSDSELFEKFRACLDAGGSKLEAGQLHERLLRLQDIASARERVGAR